LEEFFTLGEIRKNSDTGKNNIAIIKKRFCSVSEKIHPPIPTPISKKPIIIKALEVPNCGIRKKTGINVPANDPKVDDDNMDPIEFPNGCPAWL